MPGPAPKPAHLRQRMNKKATKATLPAAADSAKNGVPPLPKRGGGWHPMVSEWWASVWRSPMASEYLDADMRGGLFHLAHLHEMFWEATEQGFEAVNILPKLASEIRLQEVRFGLSPIDRSRLQWEVEKGAEAAERIESRRKPKAAPKVAKDPRAALRAV